MLWHSERRRALAHEAWSCAHPCQGWQMTATSNALRHAKSCKYALSLSSNVCSPWQDASIFERSWHVDFHIGQPVHRRDAMHSAPVSGPPTGKSWTKQRCHGSCRLGRPAWKGCWMIPTLPQHRCFQRRPETQLLDSERLWRVSPTVWVSKGSSETISLNKLDTTQKRATVAATVRVYRHIQNIRNDRQCIKHHQTISKTVLSFNALCVAGLTALLFVRHAKLQLFCHLTASWCRLYDHPTELGLERPMSYVVRQQHNQSDNHLNVERKRGKHFANSKQRHESATRPKDLIGMRSLLPIWS